MNIEALVREKAQAAKEASRILATMKPQEKNRALHAMADMLEKRAKLILDANAEDLEEARMKKDVKRSYLDRLMLDESRIHAMAQGLRETAALADPVGRGDFSTVRPNGLEIRRVRVPLGVVGIIYEARPNVTADAAGLCLKSGNAVLLRGGSEAIRSNTAIASLLAQAAQEAGVPRGAIGFIDATDRQGVEVMLHLNGLLDAVIPRGGAGLIRAVVQGSTLPVIETGSGVCHTFVDASADLAMAEKIALNAKVSRPSVCNAMETLLVHENIAADFLPRIVRSMEAAGVEVRGSEKARAICGALAEATEDDWSMEYGDLILSVKVVRDMDEAIVHINRYNTGHSEAIVTNDVKNAHRFQAEVDAAAVYVNASTRFTDGGEFGFGAEIGISTQKLHARGPMGLVELTTMKYLIYGEGQVRE